MHLTQTILAGTNVPVTLLPHIDELTCRFKLVDGPDGIHHIGYKMTENQRRVAKPDTPVGSTTGKTGRKQVEVRYKDSSGGTVKARYQVSRIVFMMAYGPFDETMVVDHIDGDPTNNRPSNLRLATYHENFMNRNVHLGVYDKKDVGLPVGVTLDRHFKSGIRYIGKATIKGVTHKGYFENPRAATHWLAHIRKTHLGEMARRDERGRIIGAPNTTPFRK
jgi:hypothetical protein